MPGLGDEFRAAREARHLSLSDVSEQIHIRSVYLQSIEDGDAGFAAPVYVRGFIRTYARFLGLDPEVAVVALTGADTAQAPTRATALPDSRTSHRGSGLSGWLALSIVVAVVLVLFVGYKYVELQRDGVGPVAVATVAAGVPAEPRASASPKAEVASPAPTDPATNRTLRLHFVADSWMSVRVDGVAVLEGLEKAGTTKLFHGAFADVRAGNAGGVELAVNGRDLGKMGASGDVVERSLRLGTE